MVDASKYNSKYFSPFIPCSVKHMKIMMSNILIDAICLRDYRNINAINHKYSI
jgi:hypothetical protein